MSESSDSDNSLFCIIKVQTPYYIINQKNDNKIVEIATTPKSSGDKIRAKNSSYYQ